MLASFLCPRPRTTYLPKVAGDYCTVGESPASQGTKGFGGRVFAVVLEVDLANTVCLPTATRRAGNLELENLSVLAALVFDVFADFYKRLVVIKIVAIRTSYLHTHRCR